MKQLQIHPASAWHPGAIGFYNLPENVYREAPGMNYSVLKHEIPQHIRQAMRNPIKVTDDMDIGTLLHAALLEPHTFGLNKSHYIQPEDYEAGKEGRKPWHNGAAYCKLWNETHKDKPILSVEDVVNVEQMRDSFRFDPIGAMLDAKAHKEVAAFAMHPSGILVKAKIDMLAIEDGDPPTVWCPDLKKLAKAFAPEHKFEARCADLNYDVQHGCTTFIVSTLLECPPEWVRFTHCTIEDAAPYLVRWNELLDESKTFGLAHFNAIVHRWAKAVQSGDFKTVLGINLPKWKLERGV
jgi:hypothetical protein